MNTKSESKDNRSADLNPRDPRGLREERKRSLTRRTRRALGHSRQHLPFAVHTLLNRSYLYQTSRRRIHPTRRILYLAANIVAHDPYLERMAVSRAIAHGDPGDGDSGKRQKDQILYLEALESPQDDPVQLACRGIQTAAFDVHWQGDARLAEAAELSAWFKNVPLSKVTSSTITAQSRLVVDLAVSAERGYFMTRGENVADVTAIAVPVRVNNELLGLAVAVRRIHGPGSHRHGNYYWRPSVVCIRKKASRPHDWLPEPARRRPERRALGAHQSSARPQCAQPGDLATGQRIPVACRILVIKAAVITGVGRCGSAAGGDLRKNLQLCVRQEAGGVFR